MKIVLNPAEAKEVKKVYASLKKGVHSIDEAVGDEATEFESLTDMFAGSKIANVQVGLTGVTINIDPAFVSDICTLYVEYLDQTMGHIAALVKSMIRLEERATLKLMKWY